MTWSEEKSVMAVAKERKAFVEVVGTMELDREGLCAANDYVARRFRGKASATCDCCGKPASCLTAEVTAVGLVVCAECQAERGRQEQLTTAARAMVPAARVLRAELGILVQADDVSAAGLAAAQVNWERLDRRFCLCGPSTRLTAYYRDLNSGRHGWMCRGCNCVTQVG